MPYRDLVKRTLFIKILLEIVNSLATTVVPSLLYRGVRLYSLDKGPASSIIAFLCESKDEAFEYARYPPHAVFFRHIKNGQRVFDFTCQQNIDALKLAARTANLPDIFTAFAAINGPANTSFENDVFILFDSVVPVNVIGFFRRTFSSTFNRSVEEFSLYRRCIENNESLL